LNVRLTLKGVVEKLESKVIQLEDKVIGLEVQLKENVNLISLKI
jgi:hypothetical protein